MMNDNLPSKISPRRQYIYKHCKYIWWDVADDYACSKYCNVIHNLEELYMRNWGDKANYSRIKKLTHRRKKNNKWKLTHRKLLNKESLLYSSGPHGVETVKECTQPLLDLKA